MRLKFPMLVLLVTFPNSGFAGPKLSYKLIYPDKKEQIFSVDAQHKIFDLDGTAFSCVLKKQSTNASTPSGPYSVSLLCTANQYSAGIVATCPTPSGGASMVILDKTTSYTITIDCT